MSRGVWQKEKEGFLQPGVDVFPFPFPSPSSCSFLFTIFLFPRVFCRLPFFPLSGKEKNSERTAGLELWNRQMDQGATDDMIDRIDEGTTTKKPPSPPPSRTQPKTEARPNPPDLSNSAPPYKPFEIVTEETPVLYLVIPLTARSTMAPTARDTTSWKSQASPIFTFVAPIRFLPSHLI